MQTINVEVYPTPNQAPNYRRDCLDVRGAIITKMVVVGIGTEGGKSTVDILFKDEQGAEYVAMITGNLMKQVGVIIEETEKQVRDK